MVLTPRICRYFSNNRRQLWPVLALNVKHNTIQIKEFHTVKENREINKSLPLVQRNVKILGEMGSKKMSTATLYKMDQSPPARAVMMIVDLLGLDINMEDLNPVTREQDEPPFVKMNPMRTIPILNEGDFSLGDSHAIMIYLLEKYGREEHEYLYPKDNRKRALINHVLFFECGILFPRLRAIMAPTYMGKLTELTKFMKINMEDAYGMIEVFLTENKHLAGDSLTIADFSVFTTTQSLVAMHPVDEQKCPKLRQWLKNMSELEVSKRIDDRIGPNMQGQSLLKIMEINKENQQNKAKL